jgi:hypothetical protein
MALTNHLIPEERAPSNHWIRSWMGPRAGPQTVAKRKISIPIKNQTLFLQLSSPCSTVTKLWAHYTE